MFPIRMANKALLVAFLNIATILAFGCASTSVKKNPGPHDRGVRYYRPKPYLFVAPTDTAGQVKIELKYLPDYNEEYSIHVRAGIGTNKTHITLNDGWNLTQLNIDVDSKVNENIKAVGELLKAVEPFTKPGAVPTEVVRENSPGMTVTAYDVPLGYYEAVVGFRADGFKGLIGWRYIGFAPFAGCPVEISGAQCQPCDQTDLFGIVTVGNKLYFRRLSEIGTQPKSLTVEQIVLPELKQDGSPTKKN